MEVIQLADPAAFSPMRQVLYIGVPMARPWLSHLRGLQPLRGHR